MNYARSSHCGSFRSPYEHLLADRNKHFNKKLCNKISSVTANVDYDHTQFLKVICITKWQEEAILQSTFPVFCCGWLAYFMTLV